MYDFAAAPAHRVAAVSDICKIFGAETRSGEIPIRSFAYDSRMAGDGDVFVAIPGERVDGHRFVDQALAAGAVAALVSSLDGIQQTDKCILVPETVPALCYLAACHRRAMKARLIGLTGSVGKTTTKDILHAILTVACRVRKSEGNFNSTIGLPIQILKLTPEDDWMIAEMGMSYPGEIATLAKMANPDIGLWLSVQAVHMANFENLNQIAQAKAELVQNMQEGRKLVYNMDDPLVHKYAQRYQGEKITYGLTRPDARLKARIMPFPDWGGSEFELTDGDERPVSLKLPLVGRYNVSNALAACAAAMAAGFPISELGYGMRKVTAPEGRSNLISFERDIKMVDDTYNASPHAVENVLRAFAPLSPNYYRWLVLGDMLELGHQEMEIHTATGRTIAEYGFNRVTLVGPRCEHALKAIREANPSCSVEHYPTSQEAAEKMNLQIPDHARIWCKASRGIHLETVANHIFNHLKQEESCSSNS